MGGIWFYLIPGWVGLAVDLNGIGRGPGPQLRAPELQIIKRKFGFEAQIMKRTMKTILVTKIFSVQLIASGKYEAEQVEVRRAIAAEPSRRHFAWVGPHISPSLGTYTISTWYMRITSSLFKVSGTSTLDSTAYMPYCDLIF